ncbi:MAG TPA: cytochrome c-type biogenesis protein [Stellaceae bacterium]|nr:cytochrome c-type biogenesis protein [Stellaceae bacterium]
MKRILAILVLVAALGGTSLAVEPSERLADPALEARARALSEQLRCVVCQNETIDESNAPLAHDLRVLLRQRIAAGDTDAQAVKFLTDRYGDFVLLKPPVEPATYVLWFGPLGLLLLAAAGGLVYLRRHKRIAEAAPLSESEQRDLQRLLTEPELNRDRS